ncbi:unnamed protein product [Amoebophrya sp. A120]|nr:unnamed protein product [Amoebophrya sp. A120]|eukprot:GSA120T00007992001.1
MTASSSTPSNYSTAGHAHATPTSYSGVPSDLKVKDPQSWSGSDVACWLQWLGFGVGTIPRHLDGPGLLRLVTSDGRGENGRGDAFWSRLNGREKSMLRSAIAPLLMQQEVEVDQGQVDDVEAGAATNSPAMMNRGGHRRVENKRDLGPRPRGTTTGTTTETTASAGSETDSATGQHGRSGDHDDPERIEQHMSHFSTKNLAGGSRSSGSRAAGAPGDSSALKNLSSSPKRSRNNVNQNQQGLLSATPLSSAKKSRTKKKLSHSPDAKLFRNDGTATGHRTNTSVAALQIQATNPDSLLLRAIEGPLVGDGQNSSKDCSVRLYSERMRQQLLAHQEGTTTSSRANLKSSITAGRHSGQNELVIPESFVSRKHFRVLHQDSGLADEEVTSTTSPLISSCVDPLDGHDDLQDPTHSCFSPWRVQDLGSTTGTFLMIRDQIFLKEGMTIQIGATELQIFFVPKCELEEIFGRLEDGELTEEEELQIFESALRGGGGKNRTTSSEQFTPGGSRDQPRDHVEDELTLLCFVQSSTAENFSIASSFRLADSDSVVELSVAGSSSFSSGGSSVALSTLHGGDERQRGSRNCKRTVEIVPSRTLYLTNARKNRERVITIGRDPTNVLAIQDKQLSTFHANVHLVVGGNTSTERATRAKTRETVEGRGSSPTPSTRFMLTDRYSTNRTWLRLSEDGQVSDPFVFRVGDVLKVGSSLFMPFDPDHLVQEDNFGASINEGQRELTDRVLLLDGRRENNNKSSSSSSFLHDLVLESERELQAKNDEDLDFFYTRRMEDERGELREWSRLGEKDEHAVLNSNNGKSSADMNAILNARTGGGGGSSSSSSSSSSSTTRTGPLDQQIHDGRANYPSSSSSSSSSSATTGSGERPQHGNDNEPQQEPQPQHPPYAASSSAAATFNSRVSFAITSEQWHLEQESREQQRLWDEAKRRALFDGMQEEENLRDVVLGDERTTNNGATTTSASAAPSSVPAGDGPPRPSRPGETDAIGTINVPSGVVHPLPPTGAIASSSTTTSGTSAAALGASPSRPRRNNNYGNNNGQENAVNILRGVLPDVILPPDDYADKLRRSRIGQRRNIPPDDVARIERNQMNSRGAGATPASASGRASASSSRGGGGNNFLTQFQQDLEEDANRRRQEENQRRIEEERVRRSTSRAGINNASWSTSSAGTTTQLAEENYRHEDSSTARNAHQLHEDRDSAWTGTTAHGGGGGPREVQHDATPTVAATANTAQVEQEPPPPQPLPEDDPNRLDRLQQREDENLCKICFDGELNCCLYPCGHVVCCQKCSKQITECPVCRYTISEVIKLFRV